MTDKGQDTPAVARRALIQGGAMIAAGFGLTSPAFAAAAGAHSVKPGRHLYFVTSNAVAGKEKEYQAWYVKHMADILKLPGFISAQHFVYHPTTGRKEPAFHYMVIYEIEGDPDKVLSALGPAVAAGKLDRPDPTLFTPAGSFIYSPVGAG